MLFRSHRVKPTALTPEVEAALVAAVELGATWEGAAMAAGVGVSTFREWRRRGERGEGDPYVALVAALKRAEGASITRALSAIQAAALAGHWQAAAWLLERRYPADYGRRTAIALEPDRLNPADQVAAALDRIRMTCEAKQSGG